MTTKPESKPPEETPTPSTVSLPSYQEWCAFFSPWLPSHLSPRGRREWTEGLTRETMQFLAQRGSLRATHPPTPEAGTVTEAMVEAAILKSCEPGIKHLPFDAWVRAILTAALAGRRGA